MAKKYLGEEGTQEIINMVKEVHEAIPEIIHQLPMIIRLNDYPEDHKAIAEAIYRMAETGESSGGTLSKQFNEYLQGLFETFGVGTNPVFISFMLVWGFVCVPMNVSDDGGHDNARYISLRTSDDLEFRLNIGHYPEKPSHTTFSVSMLESEYEEITADDVLNMLNEPQ